MISYETAREILLRQKRQLSPVTLPIDEACGHVAAQPVVSDIQVPSFANSAMDGFAVRAADLTEACEENPVTLFVTQSTVAGDAPSLVADAAGTAWEIMTGAPLPEGYDAVVKIESVILGRKQADGRPEIITLTRSVMKKNNVRYAGEDFMPGIQVVASGTVITPFHIMALAAVGKTHTRVVSKPRITVFSTGRELVNDGNTPLLLGQIHNSNGPYLMAALSELSTQAVYGGLIADVSEIFEQKVQQALSSTDMFISIGAVSAGRYDFIPDSLCKLGAKILFHKVAVRPGKPILYARFPSGACYFGLPGNPASTSVGFRFFVVPLLRHLQGRGMETPITARLLKPFSKKNDLRFFCKAYVSVSMEGEFQVEILRGQESFKIHPLLKANAWAVFEENQNEFKVGKAIMVYPLVPGKWNLNGTDSLRDLLPTTFMTEEDK